MFETRERAAMGRIGRLTTRHGTVTTPTLLPVINPNLNRVTPRRMRDLFGTQIVITNSYIIRKSGTLRAKAEAEGVHALLDWDGPVMTDSGTFQSYVYGGVDVTPEEVVAFQRSIGVDVGTVLDVFTVPETPAEEARREMDETRRRVEAAVEAKGDMLLAATVQGGRFPDLREEAARGVGALAADVHPIGGVVPLMEQARYADLARVILAARRGLPYGRPVHLFGAGHPLVFPLAVALGCDLFDSASYAKYAKDGRMIFPWGTRILEELDDLPCACASCSRWKGATELRRASADEREEALTLHNLAVSFAEIRRVRQAVRDGDLWELVEERATQNPALQDALRVLEEPEHLVQAERSEPVSGTRAFQYRGRHTLHRPAVDRLRTRILERWTPRHDRCLVLADAPKPYTFHYQAYLDAMKGWDPVVDTPFGPVPLELDLVWPVAQSLFPHRLDSGSRRDRSAYAEVFFRKVDGCEVHPFVAEEHDAVAEPAVDVLDAFDAVRVRSVARHQFGVRAGDALTAGVLSFRRSPLNRRVRNVMVDGLHVASLRARDGLLSLTFEGGTRLREAVAAPGLRFVLEKDAAAFVAEGKNPMARFIEAADEALRPGDECLLVDPQDALIAVGRTYVAGWEVATIARGPAARTRSRSDAS
jgi:7-cyano-7-deazaguanine tRNA-ribosyltransferase